jgi:hypothetical protein
MSTADGWDFTVPDDEAELLAELRRHGVTPGERFRLIHNPDLASDQEPEAETPRRQFKFAGSFSAEPDLSQRVDYYLERDGFGRE